MFFFCLVGFEILVDGLLLIENFFFFFFNDGHFILCCSGNQSVNF